MQPLTIQFWMDGSGSINFSPLPFEILKKPTDILFWEWFHVEVKTGHTPAGTVDEIKKFWYDNVFTAVVPSTDEASDLTMEIIGSLLGMFGDQPLKKSQTWSGYPIRKRYKFQGINISIENPAGTLRTGKDPDGKEWRSLLHFDYGYILGTDGKAPDGDLLDCFIGANKDSDKVFVIHQKHVKTGKYDEDKVMLGWLNKTDAVRDYLKNYNRSDMYSGVSVMTIDEFKKKAYATAKKPMMIKAKIKAHPRKMKSGKIVQVREHQDSRTKKTTNIIKYPVLTSNIEDNTKKVAKAYIKEIKNRKSADDLSAFIKGEHPYYSAGSFWGKLATANKNNNDVGDSYLWDILPDHVALYLNKKINARSKKNINWEEMFNYFKGKK